MELGFVELLLLIIAILVALIYFQMLKEARKREAEVVERADEAGAAPVETTPTAE